MKVVVLGGGTSFERPVSLRSQAFCADALSQLHEVVRFDFTGDTIELISALRREKPDCVFNILHGGVGENGMIQALLELEEMPYTHSGVVASAIAFDKEISKQAYAAGGVPFARSVILSPDAVDDLDSFQGPLVVKPIRDGSSNNVRIVDDVDEVRRIAIAADHDLMAEQYIPGLELTVGVMGDQVLPITRIIMESDLYGYDDKYTDDRSTHILPADLPPDVTQRCQNLALAAAKSIGCKGVSRTDFRWDPTRGVDGLVALETNTQPGMRGQALVVEQAVAAGFDHVQFCDWMVKDASLNR